MRARVTNLIAYFKISSQRQDLNHAIAFWKSLNISISLVKFGVQLCQTLFVNQLNLFQWKDLF